MLADKLPINTLLFFALACEAKPFITHFGFKKNLEHTVFDIYQADNRLLIITGVGKVAMAAGVAYCLALWKGEQPPVMFNLGIAGHQTAGIGELWLAEKITDADSAKYFYPQCLPNTNLNSKALVTFSQPQAEYSPNSLQDMEASAFYETATRFTSSELVLVAKVISDNEQVTLQAINAKQVSSWMASHVAAIVALLQQYEQRAQHINALPITVFSIITQHLHFTVTEKSQLKKHLARWQVLTNNAELPVSLNQFTSAHQYLVELNALIEQLPVQL